MSGFNEREELYCEIIAKQTPRAKKFINNFCESVYTQINNKFN